MLNTDHTYWNEYLATRPICPDDFFQRIYQYHRSPPDTALDIGSGPGQAAEVLAETFHHTVALDDDPVSIAFGERRLAAAIESKQLSYCLGSAEDADTQFPPASINLITVAESIHLMDTNRVLRVFNQLLKDDGTLAIWCYGPPHFVRDGEAETKAPNNNGNKLAFDRVRAQSLISRLLDFQFSQVFERGGPEGVKSWKRAADGLHSWLDYLDFDESWRDIRRFKWNTHFTLPFWTQAACDFQIEPFSRVKPKEQAAEIQDESLWQVEWDFDMVRRFVNAIFPTPRDITGGERTGEALLEELKGVMGGEGATYRFSWPVVLVLASKTPTDGPWARGAGHTA